MRRILCLILACISLLMVGCKKESPALVELKDGSNYSFNATASLDEVREVFEKLNDVRVDVNFNGASIRLDSNIKGLINITKDELRAIDLNYDISIDSKINFRQYLLNGVLLAKGYANTESSSLSLKSRLNAELNIVNDDSYLYGAGILDNKDMTLSLKHKLNIESFTKSYKSYITAIVDLLKYYKITDFIDKDIDYISKYNITIANTTNDTFTICANIPSNLGFKEFSIEGTIPIYITLGCDNLLPRSISLNASELIGLWLENKYVEEYISSSVEVASANLDINIAINYDYVEVKELAEEEKALYSLYKFN